jgi:hypothetical protein
LALGFVCWRFFWLHLCVLLVVIHLEAWQIGSLLGFEVLLFLLDEHLGTSFGDLVVAGNDRRI